MSEEHINATESHNATECPQDDTCACHTGLKRILAQLDAGTHHFVEVNQDD